MEFDQEIHPTAIVHPQAKLANNVKIGAYSVIGKSVELGEGTEIGNHVNITGFTKIGKLNKIYHFSSIGEQPQDMKYKDQETFLEIGHRNTIREISLLQRLIKTLKKLRVRVMRLQQKYMLMPSQKTKIFMISSEALKLTEKALKERMIF